MATSSDELVGKLSAMAISGGGEQERVDGNISSTSNCSDPPEKDCQNHIQPTKVVGSCDRTTEDVHALKKDAVMQFFKPIERSDKGLLIQDFLRYFDKDIRNIIDRHIHDTPFLRLWWKVAEECYKEAISPMGILNADRYLNDSKNSQPRRRVDSVSGNQEHVFNDKRKREWIDSWVTILNRAPSGSTLFYPRTSNDIDLTNPKTIPPYLFRVFDRKSSGKNDREVMASSRHASQVQTSGVDDLLGMKDVEATELLSYHIGDKWTRKNDNQDNLVSWTNSLLYAVQYATYRQHRLAILNTDIKICMVHTSQFPQGQFVGDIELLRKYLPVANEVGGEVERVFNRRLYQQEFYNGEYFSQGVVSHGGRSCVVSLKQLEDAGIFKLYPALEDPSDHEGVIRNALKVLNLRQIWSLERTTTDKEISYALNIAQECFKGFDVSDIACMLLGFRNHKLLNGVKLTTNHAPSWADKPIKVERYWQILETVKHLKEDLGHDVKMRDVYRAPSVMRIVS